MKKFNAFLISLFILSGCVNSRSEVVDKGVNEQLHIDNPIVVGTSWTGRAKELITDIIFTYRSNNSIQSSPRPLQNGSQLHSGDLYKIQFTSRENCYVYIFQYDSSHKLFTLFPTKNFIGQDSDLDNPVQANRTYFVPGVGKSFVLDNQTGSESIHFLVLRNPNPDLERQYKALLHRQQGNSPRMMAQYKIKEFIEKGPQSQTRFDNGSIVKSDQEGMFTQIIGQRLVCKKDNCVKSITFQHLP